MRAQTGRKEDQIVNGVGSAVPQRSRSGGTPSHRCLQFCPLRVSDLFDQSASAMPDIPDRCQAAAWSELHRDSSLIDDEVHSRKLNEALNMRFRCFKCRTGVIALQGFNDGKVFRRIWCQAVFQLADFKEARGGSQIA